MQLGKEPLRKTSEKQADYKVRVAERNNSTILGWILVRHPGPSVGAYRDMWRRM